MINDRWDEQEAEKFPSYMKGLYTSIIHDINDITEELKVQGNSHAEFVKRLVSI